MAAYFTPPLGKVSLAEVQEMLVDRFSFLRTMQINTLLEPENRYNMPKVRPEFLAAGTMKDCTSHFMLRLASVLTDPIHGSGFRDLLVEGEALLWRERIRKLAPAQVHNLHKLFLSEVSEEKQRFFDDMKPALRIRHVREHVIRYVRFMKGFEKLLEDTVRWHDDHPMELNGDEECSKHVALVPWWLVQSLVSRRLVTLRRGQAALPCQLLLEAMLEAFQTNIRFSQQTLGLLRRDQKQRAEVVELSNKMAVICQRRPEMPDLEGIRASQVGEELQYFPPCMQLAFRRLGTEHNVGHDTRWHMTLHLKALNMSVDEQMSFWKAMYSKPAPSLGNKRKWNQRKYAYSIRHMYGLEGKRVPQHAASCARIQMLPCTSELHCPFMMSRQALGPLLPDTFSEPVKTQILQHVADRKPNLACSAALVAAKGCEAEGSTVIDYPATYYLKFKDLLEW